MKRLAEQGLLDLDVMTVTGQTLGENLAAAEIRDEEIIRPFDRPVHPEGGIAILKGNLAPDGAVVKQAAVAPAMRQRPGRPASSTAKKTRWTPSWAGASGPATSW